MTILVTGAAGFIGFHLTSRLLREGKNVIGFDNFNNYYDPKLKHARYNELKNQALEQNNEFTIVNGDLNDQNELNKLFNSFQPTHVVNLAAQAGVRFSIENPYSYIQSNLVGFGNILECCRNYNVEHLIYASSSSVYGGNTNLPFSEKNGVDHPVSLYAATKRSNEIIAHSYSHLYGISATGLRFFTVYGPWGRPDMALFLFTKAILNNEPIKVFNHGAMIRDFTYVEDIVESLYRVIYKKATPNSNFDKKQPDPATSWAPHRIFNIGNSKPTELMTYIETLEEALGKKARKLMLPMQPGDVSSTAADTSALEEWTGFKPNTSVREGVYSFVKWYKGFYGY